MLLLKRSGKKKEIVSAGKCFVILAAAVAALISCRGRIDLLTKVGNSLFELVPVNEKLGSVLKLLVCQFWPEAARSSRDKCNDHKRLDKGRSR